MRFHRLCGAAIAVAIGLAVTATPGRAEDPKELVFIFQKQKDPAKIKASADTLAARLGEKLGLKVIVQVPADYAASVQAIVNKKADFAYVSAMPFLLAQRDGKAEILLVEERKDASGTARTDYDSVLVVAKDSPLKSVDDLKKDAKNVRMVFTSTTSTSGYIFAFKRFVDEGLLKPKQDPREVFKSVAFGGGYTQALEQVLQGRGDVAAVSDYTVEGAKADVYLKKEDRENLRVLARTPGVPTHLIAARDGLSAELKEKVKGALLAVAKENPELLADVYGATAFVEPKGKHARKAAEAIEAIGLPIEGLAK